MPKKLRKFEVDESVRKYRDKLLCNYGIKNAYTIAHRLKLELKKIKEKNVRNSRS